MQRILFGYFLLFAPQSIFVASAVFRLECTRYDQLKEVIDTQSFFEKKIFLLDTSKFMISQYIFGICLDICLSKSRFNHIRDYWYWVTYEPINDTIEIQRCDQFGIQINDQTNVRKKIKTFCLWNFFFSYLKSNCM